MKEPALCAYAPLRYAQNDKIYRPKTFQTSSNGTLTQAERLELMALRHEADLFMLQKAQAAVLLRWRGYSVPVP